MESVAQRPAAEQHSVFISCFGIGAARWSAFTARSTSRRANAKGAALMLNALPQANAMLGDRGYHANWFSLALTARGICTRIPSKANRNVLIPHDRALYRQRRKIENMFGRIKNRRRIHTRYDRCARTFSSAICIAAAVIWWLQGVWTLIRPQNVAKGSSGTFMREFTFIDFAKLTFLQRLGGAIRTKKRDESFSYSADHSRRVSRATYPGSPFFPAPRPYAGTPQ
jgi:transposase